VAEAVLSWPRRFGVYLVQLDPTVGSEIKKTRPCAVISPDEMNRSLRTVIIAPLTSGGRPYPSRIPVRFDDVDGSIALDQIRTVDRQRLIRRIGVLDTATADQTLAALAAMFIQ